MRASGAISPWIKKLVERRARSVSSAGISHTLSGLPTNVIEALLIVEVFACRGGLRLVSWLLPLRTAINSMIDGVNLGQALDRLKTISERKGRKSLLDQLYDGQALRLELEKVPFGFISHKAVGHDISFSVAPGQKIFVVVRS